MRACVRGLAELLVAAQLIESCLRLWNCSGRVYYSGDKLSYLVYGKLGMNGYYRGLAVGVLANELRLRTRFVSG